MAFRGSGVRLTLPFVFRFLGLWMAVTVLIVLVFSVTSFLLLADRLTGHEGIAFGILIAQTVITVLAVAALGVFTTHRLAGPIIALQRTFDAVREGDLDRQLRFRQSDDHLRGVETSFNEMMGVLKTRIEGERTPAARAQ